jgi:hypothetical protein
VGRPPRTKVFETRSRTYGRKSVIKASYTRNFKAGKKWSGRMEAHARYLEQGHDHEPGYKAPGFMVATLRTGG